ncbi:MAG TPA: potassium channel family protein [Candidatus Acidoferrales bacterium]|nr:potassium channel family protein [Candidatus Acidoferrales bacterium]
MDMTTPALVAGLALLLTVLWDAFETMVLPRRVTRRVRLARLFYRFTWRPWSAITRRLPAGKRRESFLSFFGPLSLLFLVTFWALGLVLSFGLLQYGCGSEVAAPGRAPDFITDLYLSATTFFTLGMGDVTPHSGLARMLTAIEAGVGFGFLAIVIGYLPVIYQSFSRREVNISLLDARAGSPPTAGELLRRHAFPGGLDALQRLLSDWERWSAELMESHLSYPMLAYFRSQHDNQSWLASMTAILDTCALLMAGVEGACARQAELTFAIARHAIVDLAQIFIARPDAADGGRLGAEALQSLRTNLAPRGLHLSSSAAADQRLAQLRALYEPYVTTLGRYLNLEIPALIPEAARKDNWQTTVWDRSSAVLHDARGIRDDHH